jgi:ABC-type dipeptide/oligopeptide/nickel transport system permease component
MAYLLKRLAFGALTLFVISVLVFILARVSGDPAELLFPLSAGATREQQQEFRREYGLDQPLLIQYWVFISHAVRGDFGKSLQFGTPAMSEVLSRAPATLLLAVSSTLLAVLIGVPFGVLAAVRPNSWYDNVFKAFAVFGHAAPVYWIGLMMIWLFAAVWRVLPSSGSGTPAHLVMPMIVQAWASLAILMRLTRASMLEVLSADYIRYARAKGVPEWRVILGHALKNASIPIITISSLDFAARLGGVAITETIFAWPGIGRLAVGAAANRDYPVVQATVLFAAAMFICINLIVDLLYVRLDPRVRVH